MHKIELNRLITRILHGEDKLFRAADANILYGCMVSQNEPRVTLGWDIDLGFKGRSTGQTDQGELSFDDESESIKGSVGEAEYSEAGRYKVAKFKRHRISIKEGKAEYILENTTRVAWELSLNNPLTINLLLLKITLPRYKIIKTSSILF